MKDVLLHGLYLEFFKGIGEDGIKLAPLQKMNFLVGPNNSGKSSVLQFLAKYLHGKTEGDWTRDWSREDIPIGRRAADIKFGFGVPARVASKIFENADLNKLISLLAENEYIWVTPRENSREMELLDWSPESAGKLVPHYEWQMHWNAVTGYSGGDRNDWIPVTLRTIATKVAPQLPKARLIPAIRQISGEDKPMDFSGSGLINELAKLQNPDFHKQELKSKFKAIERFVRSVTDVEEATIEVPHARTHLVVHMGGKALPLAALGTGIHEIVMLAAFCTLAENEIVCLEEPEIHLHPLLQRKLIRYLHAYTSNQYFIATHSSAMLDAVPAAVFSVMQSSGSTRIRLASTPNDKFEICRALGYQASDLLQCNAVIWVEGPSDRIYLLHWIKSVAPELIEGIDFSIMFYGGRLLSHLSATDDEITDFISLRRLNRNVAIVIDSDKSSRSARINATKKRIADELADGYVWITKGREIENYLTASVVSKTLNEVCTSIGCLGSIGQYEHVLSYVDTKGKSLAADKVKVARAVVSGEAELDVLDLRKRITQLVDFIRKASEHRQHDPTT